MCWKNSKAEICTDLKGIKSDGTTLWKICQTQAKREWMSECACNVREYKTETCRQTDTERDTEKHNDKDTESKQIFATNHLDPTPATPTHTHTQIPHKVHHKTHEWVPKAGKSFPFFQHLLSIRIRLCTCSLVWHTVYQQAARLLTAIKIKKIKNLSPPQNYKQMQVYKNKEPPPPNPQKQNTQMNGTWCVTPSEPLRLY